MSVLPELAAAVQPVLLLTSKLAKDCTVQSPMYGKAEMQCVECANMHAVL